MTEKSQDDSRGRSAQDGRLRVPEIPPFAPPPPVPPPDDRPREEKASPPPPARRESFFAKKRPWLNAALFVLTVASTYFVGLSQSAAYVLIERNGPDAASDLEPSILADAAVVRMSLLYVVVLMGILLGHELGHYLACRRYGIDATLPYFMPFPNLIGTLGAFIKIRSPIQRKKQLFDIGAAGPLTGFLLALPALAYGLSRSRVTVDSGGDSWLSLGDPLILNLLAGAFSPDSSSAILLHPVAFAGWVGMLVTAFNLFPVGQLDGGHIVYALFGRRARLVARASLVAFAVLGVFFWVGWFVWAVLILLVGLKHPPIWDERAPLSSSRKLLAAALVLIFILSFIPDPIEGFSLLSLIR
ncbi:MAG: site-2 protease family protein [Candidatus Aminicenantes bacterium]|nr:site-2 protease family protein [Candidatus Aminicenantes bacterium]